MLQSTRENLEDNAMKSARELQAAKEEKYELLKQLQALTESKEQAMVDRDASKKLRELEAEKAALLKILEDKASTERRAETKRLIELKIHKSEMANLKAMGTWQSSRNPPGTYPDTYPTAR